VAAVSKALGSVLNVITAPLTLIDKGLGQTLSGIAITAIGVATGQAWLVGIGLSRLGSSIAGNPASRADTTESSRKSPIPSRKRAYGELRLYGDWLLFGHKSDGTPVDVWAFHDGRASQILQVYLNDDKVTISGGIVQALPDKRYRDQRVLAGYNLGATPNTAHAAVVAALPGVWTANHRGDGIVTGYLIKKMIKSELFLECYPNGDDIQMSLAGRWTPVFDFRDPAQSPTNPATWAYRNNAVLALLHYFMTQRGVDFTTQIAPQLDKWTAAANDCDIAVPLASGGAEARYRIALAYAATEQPSAVIAAILNCFDGWYCENERGEIIVYSGRYDPPTVSIGPGQIESYSLQRHVVAEDALNEVTVTYVSSAHDYATVDAQPWRDEDAIAASGREPVTASLDAQVPSHTQARRLAKRKMARANAPSRGTIITTYGGRIALGERYIHLRIEEAGAVFFDGVAEIVGPPERDMQTGGVRFEWVAADPNIDAWNPATEDGLGAPVGALPNIVPLAAPIIVSITPTYGQNTAYGVPGVKLTIVASGPDRDDLIWFVRTRTEAGVSWLEQRYPDVDPGESVTLQTDFLPLGNIEAQVAYGTGDGRISPWSELGAPVDTGNVLPAPVTGLSVSTNSTGTLIVADWDDSAQGQRYLVEIIVEP
jgi:hypothetical protein